MLGFIKQGLPFNGELIGAGCYIKIDEYLPVVCTAIHAGHRLRPDLHKQCLLNPDERYFEEDPFTDQMIASQPITLIGLDSRFEYDLNRPMALSTYYKSAWSRQVWQKALSAHQRQESHRKHAAFYTLYQALIGKLEALHGMVVVFDLHSYNYKRQKADAPIFNIGTAQIDMERWGLVVKRFCTELEQITLPNMTTSAAINAVFEGRGYLISHTNAHFDRTLVLPTEVKNLYGGRERNPISAGVGSSANRSSKPLAKQVLISSAALTDSIALAKPTCSAHRLNQQYCTLTRRCINWRKIGNA